MSTKISLEYPFSDKYSKGYLNTNRERRKTVYLYNSRIDRSSISYARYLMSVKLGRFLDKEEQVDHINNDKTDDSIENLQILSRIENHKKYGNIDKSLQFNCANCNKMFNRSKQRSYGRFANKKAFCSRQCLYDYMRK